MKPAALGRVTLSSKKKRLIYACDFLYITNLASWLFIAGSQLMSGPSILWANGAFGIIYSTVRMGHVIEPISI